MEDIGKEKDFSLPFLAAKRLLDSYYQAMLDRNKDLALQIAVDLVEVSLKLEDIAYDSNNTNSS
jgi:hypothetical protein